MCMFYSCSFRIEHAFDCEIHISAMEKNAMYYTNIINAITTHNRANKCVAVYTIDILRLIITKKLIISTERNFELDFNETIER